tara:strand:- start:731 stop:1069 length:339 start_codon:yes stop_codon:yes gene_type:complete
MKIKLEHFIEGIGVTIAIILFVYEFRNAGEESKVILWVMLVSILVLISILLSINYFLLKLEQIKNNKKKLIKLNGEISEIKKELNMRLALEEINYRIGKLESKRKNAKKEKA